MINLPPNTRIVVIGASASGKTTLATRLAQRLGVPFVELDELYWGPAWTPKTTSEFKRLVHERTVGPSWIVAGNYSGVRDLLWPRANTIIWLNYPLALVLWRGVRRTFMRCVTGERLWHGNRESLRRTLFSKDSILYWIVTTHARRKAQFAALRSSQEYGHLRWIEFTRHREMEKWLEATAP